MSYILDDLAALGVDEMVFVVGYLRETIESYVADAYPNITAHYVVQEIQDGTAGAVSLAEPFVDEDVLISSWIRSSMRISGWFATSPRPQGVSSGRRRWRITSGTG